MIRRPPRSTRTDTLFPYTTLFRSAVARAAVADLLPALIAQRRTKGGPTGFLRRVFNARADDAIRMLVDGRLIAAGVLDPEWLRRVRSEEHTSELQSLMRISYAVFCLKKKKKQTKKHR